MFNPSSTFANTQRNRTIGKESLHEFPRKPFAPTKVDTNVPKTRKKSVSFGSMDVRNFKSHLPPNAISEIQNLSSSTVAHSVSTKKIINSHDGNSVSANKNRNASQRFEVLHLEKSPVATAGKGLYDILKEKNSPQESSKKATKTIQSHNNKKKTPNESTHNNKIILDEPIIRSTPTLSTPQNAVYAALAASKAVSKDDRTNDKLSSSGNTSIKKKQSHTPSTTLLLDKKNSLSSLTKNSKKKKKSKTKESNEGTKANSRKSTVIKIPDNKKEIMDQIIKDNELASKDNHKATNETCGQQSSQDITHGNKDTSDKEKMQESMVVNDKCTTKTNDGNVNSEKDIQRANVDYAKLNNNLDDMVSAYIMGIYDDDVGIEYDMPNSIIETSEDIEKYNQQVLLLEKEFASGNDEKKANIKETKLNGDEAKQDENLNDANEQENRPILSDDVVERFDVDEDKYPTLGAGEEEDDDLGLSSEILNLEISQSYQSLKQLLMGSNFTKLSNQEKEFEELNENGEPIKISRFRAAQLSLSDSALFENLN